MPHQHRKSGEFKPMCFFSQLYPPIWWVSHLNLRTITMITVITTAIPTRIPWPWRPRLREWRGRAKNWVNDQLKMVIFSYKMVIFHRFLYIQQRVLWQNYGDPGNLWHSMAQPWNEIHGPVGQREAAIAAGTSEGCLCSQPEVNCFRYWFKLSPFWQRFGEGMRSHNTMASHIRWLGGKPQSKKAWPNTWIKTVKSAPHFWGSKVHQSSWFGVQAIGFW
jgi:hypothetical protein